MQGARSTFSAITVRILPTVKNKANPCADDEVAAARAYDEASVRMRGPDAPVNFPDSVVIKPQAANGGGGGGDAMEISTTNSLNFDTMMQFTGTGNSLPHLGNGSGFTNESVDSVRDPTLELQAVKMTLAMQQHKKTVPPDFMSL